jgi:Ca-activated chloride channel homolog
VRMENEELKRILNQISIPEHGYESKKRAITSALAEFRHHARQREERSKGFSLHDRLINKKLRGGFFMNRSIAIAAGTLAIFVIAFAVVFSPEMIPQRARISAPEIQQIPIQKKQASQSKPVESIAGIPQSHGEPQIAENKVPDANTLKNLEAANITAPLVTERVVRKAEEIPTIDQAASAVINYIDIKEAPPIFEATLAKQGISNPEYVGRDKFENIKPNPVKLVSEEPVSTFSIDVDTASYAFVRRALNNGYLPQADSVRIEEMINYFDYEYPLPKDKSVPFKPTVAVFPTPWNPDTKLLHIGIKGYDIIPDKKPRANLVFLIDVSGSMESQDKLPLLKNSLRMLVDTLAPDDTVAIAVYAGAAGTVLERTKVSEKSKILAAIDQLHAGGSTAGGEGIHLAYSLAEAGMDPQGVNRVILATDGDFNVGITDTDVLQDFVERKRKSGIYLSVLGFGQGNYNDALMQKLAQNGNGNAAYIDNLNEARKVLVDESYGTLFTIAKDVKIQIEFNPSMVSKYRLIGYETRLLNREDFKNDNVDAGDIGSGHSVTAIYEITPKGSNAQLIDDLRYDSRKNPDSDKKTGNNSEYAYLKIRYKLPEETSSREISTAIDNINEYKNISDAPGDTRFASAVAAFGQLLKGDSHINQFTYDDVINLARDSIRVDPFGYRIEFLNLVRLAKTAAPMGDR